MNKISKKIVENYNLLKSRKELNILNAISRFNTYQKHDRVREEIYYDPKFTYKDVKIRTSTKHNKSKAENKKRREEKHADEVRCEEIELEEKLIYAIQCKNRYCMLSDLEKNYEVSSEHALITNKIKRENKIGVEKIEISGLNKSDELMNFGKKNIWIVFVYLDLISHIKKMNLDFTATPIKSTNYNNISSCSTPLIPINPNLICIRNTPVLDKTQQSGTQDNLDENRSFNLKRKGTLDDSQNDLEQTLTESLSIPEKGGVSGSERETNSCKRSKAELKGKNMLIGNTKINFSLKTKDGFGTAQSTQNNWTDNQMITNESNGNGENWGGTLTEKALENANTRQLNDFPSANAQTTPSANAQLTTLKLLHKPKMLTREQYSRKKDDTPKPKTILILLTQDQLKFAQSGVNIGEYVMEKTQSRLEFSSGAVNGYTLINHKLFLYPGSNEDHDKIFTNKKWSLGSNEMYSLENKGNLLILRGVSVEEIETHAKISEDLQRIGIKRWRPLVGEDTKYMGVKAECHTRGNLIDIMHKHFVDGRSYSLNNGKTAYVRFDPDIKKSDAMLQLLSATVFKRTSPLRGQMCQGTNVW
jgi:hypothetical protein